MKWYQFQLATVCLVTLVAGVLLGLNFTPRPPPKVEYAGWTTAGHSYGWPSTWHDARLVRAQQPFDSLLVPWLG